LYVHIFKKTNTFTVLDIVSIQANPLYLSDYFHEKNLKLQLFIYNNKSHIVINTQREKNRGLDVPGSLLLIYNPFSRKSLKTALLAFSIGIFEDIILLLMVSGELYTFQSIDDSITI